MRELLKDQMHVPGMGHVYGHDCDGNELKLSPLDELYYEKACENRRNGGDAEFDEERSYQCGNTRGLKMTSSSSMLTRITQL